jgi:hypothetical protein
MDNDLFAPEGAVSVGSLCMGFGRFPQLTNVTPANGNTDCDDADPAVRQCSP